MDTARMNIKSGKSQIESEEVDREIELSPSKTPMPVPFKRQFPLEILTSIISDADRNDLAACLRVSKQFIHIAGERLYARLEVNRETGWREIMMGAGININTPRESKIEATRLADASPLPRTNYKRQLLSYVETISVRNHCCPDEYTPGLSETLEALTSLKRAIMAPGADCQRSTSICEGSDYDWCPIVELLPHESLTLHDCELEVLVHGTEDMFTTALHQVQRATLVIPPTLQHINAMEIPRGELLGPPPCLEILKLIFADNQDKSLIPTPLISMGALIKSVALCLKLGNWKIEIYIFNDFNNTLDLVDFREKLKIEVDDAIKAMPEKERPAWTPNYEVCGLEDYFNHPDMYLELDHEWMMSWRMELDRRQRAQREEDKRIVEFGKVGNLAELPFTDN